MTDKIIVALTAISLWLCSAGGVLGQNSPDTVTLREYVDKVFAERRAQSVERSGAQDRAIEKAQASVEKRLDSMNEFREQLKDQAATFLSRTEYAANHKQMSEQVAALTLTEVPRAEHEVRWKGDDERYKILSDKLDAQSVLQSQASGRLEGCQWLLGGMATFGSLALGAIAFLKRQPAPST